MELIGVGTDLVPVERFTRMIDRGGLRFLERWFCPNEVAYCLGREAPARHVAARFAAKEAALKSLRIRGEAPLRWREIEITRSPEGLPGLQLHGSMRGLGTTVGASVFHVSLSHDEHYATATVLAMGPGPGQPAAP